MKHITWLKIVVALISITIIALFINSCKKVDMKAPDSKTAQEEKAQIVKAIQDKYGPVSSIQTYPVNKEPQSLSYRNSTGSMVNFKAADPIINAPCFYNCTNTTNPANLHLVYTVESIQRTYYCQSNSLGYQNDVTVNWKISVPFTPLLADPSNPANLSVGSIVITPPVGYSYADNNLPITISNLGADPACSANSLYKISYTYKHNIRDQAFDNSFPIDTYLTLYNDCGLVGNLVTTSTVSTTLSGMVAPCDRTDNVSVNPYVGPGGCANVGGSNIFCIPPAYIIIDNTQLEYRAVNNINGELGWESQTSAIKYAAPAGGSGFYALVSPYGVSNMLDMISGKWLVRYRNIKGTSCVLIGTQTNPLTNPPPYPGPGNTWTGNWVVEYWNL